VAKWSAPSPQNDKLLEWSHPCQKGLAAVSLAYLGELEVSLITFCPLFCPEIRRDLLTLEVSTPQRTQTFVADLLVEIEQYTFCPKLACLAAVGGTMS